MRIDGQNESRHEKGKKKKVGIHSWIAIDINGRTESLEVDKRAIKKRTSIPTRDLRVLGPLFSASAAILRKPTLLTRLGTASPALAASASDLLQPLQTTEGNSKLSVRNVGS